MNISAKLGVILAGVAIVLGALSWWIGKTEKGDGDR